MAAAGRDALASNWSSHLPRGGALMISSIATWPNAALETAAPPRAAADVRNVLRERDEKRSLSAMCALPFIVRLPVVPANLLGLPLARTWLMKHGSRRS